MVKVLSLFDGISCGMVALERAGISVERYVAYEIDPNAIKVSEKNYPMIEHCGDVTVADFTQYQGFDLLIGGSPCQSLSVTTGKNRTHLEGKSKLFWEYVRALEEVKPKWFLFENVASMNEDSEKTISEVLGCQPIFIDSADFSAQTRERLYWTNIPVDAVHQKSGALLDDILQDDVPGKYFYDCEFDFLGYDKTVCAMLHINGHDILKRVNSPHTKCQTLTCVSGGNQQKKVLVNGWCRKLTPIEYERLQTLPDNYTEGISDTARYTAVGNGWTVAVIAHIFTHLKTNT